MDLNYELVNNANTIFSSVLKHRISAPLELGHKQTKVARSSLLNTGSVITLKVQIFEAIEKNN